MENARNALKNSAIYAEVRAFAAHYPGLHDWTWTEQAVRFTDADGNRGHTLRIVLTSDRPECETYEFRQCVWDDGDATSVARMWL